MKSECDWTDKEFSNAVSESHSMDDAAQKLGHLPGGSIQIVILGEVKRLGLDISHWKD
jgi:hypothetical protein